MALANSRERSRLTSSTVGCCWSQAATVSTSRSGARQKMRFVLHDRDAKFPASFDAVFEARGYRSHSHAPRARRTPMRMRSAGCAATPGKALARWMSDGDRPHSNRRSGASGVRSVHGAHSSEILQSASGAAVDALASCPHAGQQAIDMVKRTTTVTASVPMITCSTSSPAMSGRRAAESIEEHSLRTLYCSLVDRFDESTLPISEKLLQCSASSRLERFARSWLLQA